MDARNVNKTIQSNNHRIPRDDNIKSKLSGAIYFSKLDFKSGRWNLNLSQEISQYSMLQTMNFKVQMI